MGKSWRIVSYIGFLTVKRNSREASVEDLLVRQSVGGGRSWDVRFQREWKAFSWRVLSWSRCEESVHTYWMDFDYHSYETSGSLIDSVDVLNFKIWSLILYSLSWICLFVYSVYMSCALHLAFSNISFLLVWRLLLRCLTSLLLLSSSK